MTSPRDDWDDDERRALQGLEAELEQVRARHRDDPPFDLLRAADAGALPEPAQESLAEYLNRDAWSRALVDGAAGDESALDDLRARALLSRTNRSTRPESARFTRLSSWFPALAVAATVLIVVVGVLRQGDSLVEPSVQPPQSSAPPVVERTFALPLDKPDVKLTTGALVLRSEAPEARLAGDIAPALDAYRAGDYARADTLFAAVAAKYPAAVEPVFYRAIAQLLLGDAEAAVRLLQAARRLDDGTFAADITWYLAVAYERAGATERVKPELDRLCRGTSPYAARACVAAVRFPPS